VYRFYADAGRSTSVDRRSATTIDNQMDAVMHEAARAAAQVPLDGDAIRSGR
jgi:hypothetical protein